MKFLKTVIAPAIAVALASADLHAVSIVPQPTVMRENRSLVYLPSGKLSVYASDESLKSLEKVWAESLEKPYEPGTEKLASGFTRIVSSAVLPKIKSTGNEAKVPGGSVHKRRYRKGRMVGPPVPHSDSGPGGFIRGAR